MLAQPQVSLASLINDEDQNTLIMIREADLANYFTIGDIALKNFYASVAKGMPVTHETIYQAVGNLSGKTPRTVRYYAEASNFFPPEVREEFDMLSFAHFVFARSCGDNWRTVLEYASANPGASIDSLRKKFNGAPIQDGDFYQENDGGVEGDFPSVDTSHASASGSSRLIHALSDLVDKAEHLVAAQRLPQRTRDRLVNAIAEIRDVMPEIYQAITS